MVPTRPAARGAASPAPIPKSAAETRRIVATLGSQHPGADTELNFTTPYELLVATILSAQCTDERVNGVTPALFRRYPDARALAKATADQLEPQIQSTGFFRAKSRSLVGMARALVARHGGEVPDTMAALVELPGVGRKTANVVLGHALGVPGLPVDRHVLRVANRIGIARSEEPEAVEQQLCAAMPPEDWTVTSDRLILHGRRICKPRPLCDRCAVRDDCDYYQSIAAAPSPLPATRAAVRPPRTRAQKSSAPAAAERGGGAAAPRDGARGGGAEGGSSVGPGRAAAPRGTGRGGGAESGSSVGPRRAAAPRGTGRGGGAPRQIKK